MSKDRFRLSLSILALSVARSRPFVFPASLLMTPTALAEATTEGLRLDDGADGDAAKDAGVPPEARSVDGACANDGISSVVADRSDRNGLDSVLQDAETSLHPRDAGIVLVHVPRTSSTQDLARDLLRDGVFRSDVSDRTAFCVTAADQTDGRGTNGRTWTSRRGNAFVTVGIRYDAWVRGTALPVTLLPLSMGLLVAERIQSLLASLRSRTCAARESADGTAAPTPDSSEPVVRVKWPNDVLVDKRKISGVLIETDASGEWFLIGVGANVRVAPPVESTGADNGRPSTCIADHLCSHTSDGGSVSNSIDWEDQARQLGVDIAYELVRFLEDASDPAVTAERIVGRMEPWIDWTTPLVRRDGHDGTPVHPVSLLPDGRLVVRNTRTGREQIMTSDYFL